MRTAYNIVTNNTQVKEYLSAFPSSSTIYPKTYKKSKAGKYSKSYAENMINLPENRALNWYIELA
jgi:hypothetical protein